MISSKKLREPTKSNFYPCVMGEGSKSKERERNMAAMTPNVSKSLK